MAWDVEIWHDTTMWNEGFDLARQPYTVVRVPDEVDAQMIERAINHYNQSFQGRADPGWDRRFEVRMNPSNPNRNLQTLPAMQAIGFVQGAISTWEGL